MRSKILSLFLLLLFVTFQLNAQKTVLLIRNVNLIDMKSERIQPKMDILIEGNRISKIGKRLQAPSVAKIIDGSNKFIIPGLCDMHTHSRDVVDTAITSHVHMPLYLVNGVTTVREMWGTPAMLERKILRDKGQLLIPRLIVGSPILDGPDVMWPGTVAVRNTLQATRLVDSLTAVGYEFMKVYSLLKAPEFFAIAKEARKRHIPMVGHVPDDVPLTKAVAAGLASIEHCTGFNYAASRNEEFFREKEAEIKKDTSRDAAMKLRKWSLELYQSFDTSKLLSLVPVLIANHTWICPTLITMKGYAYRYDSNFRKDNRLKYLPQVKLAHFFPSNDSALREVNRLDQAIRTQYFLNNIEIVRHLHRAGVPMLAGSDVNNPFCFPGFSLHDELELLTTAGLTNYEALRSATVNPAFFLGRQKDIGTIEKGKLADMVILDKNPLENIGNTKSVHAVITDGIYLSKQVIDKIMENELNWAINYTKADGSK